MDPYEFVPSNGYMPRDDDPTQATQNSPRKRSRNLPLMPCTIRQIMGSQQISSDEDDFIIDKQIINQVCIVGLIISTNPQPQHYNYQIDDSTGLLDVRIWIDKDPSEYVRQMNEQWGQGRYVRVIGVIKAFGPKRTLIATRLNLVEDPNEISYHHLECLYIHLKNTMSGLVGLVPPPAVQVHVPQPHTRGGASSQGGARGNLMHQFVQQAQKPPPPLQQQQQRPSQQPQSHLQQQKRSSIFNRVQNSIMSVMKLGHAQNGMSLQDCCNRLKNIASEAEIQNQIEFLCNEGHLFSTIDEQHFAPTGSD